MRCVKIAFFLLIALISESLAGDLLDSALSSVGKSRADLGYRPKGYWNRYPYDIPYKLPAFDDLFAEPLKIYDYSYSMKSAAETYLGDSAFQDLKSSALYQLSYQLAWERKVGGFRGYSANLIDTIDSQTPLAAAIETIFLAAGEKTEFRTFGQKVEWPNIRKELLHKAQSVDTSIQRVVAIWLLNLLEACQLQQLAFRHVPFKTVSDIYRINDLDATQGDGQKYYPQFDDCAAALDWQSLVYASFKAIAASDLAARTLSNMRERGREIAFQFDTPIGKIVLNGYQSNTIPEGEYLLICDFGGNDFYYSGGGSLPYLPVSVIVDLDGNDTYGDETSSRHFGSGICGVGICLDVNGDDEYRSDRLAFGLGIFGTGLLADFAGKDDYRMKVSGQGCGYFGVGMLIDRLGDDKYYLAGDGQGNGGVGGGIGILVDYQGKDSYTAEPYTSVFNRGDYHSQNKINANNAQGFGGGRRGDGSDGHSWAGGLGALIDCSGDDEYYSGNFTLGCGYWFGIGIVYDVNGNDLYKSCYFTQASGAHYCIGAIFDETGDDKHELYETAGAGLSFGWDFTETFLVDWEGNDSYSGKIISIANSQIRSNSFLFDFAGVDRYQLNRGTDGMGESTFREEFRTPRPTVPFTYYAEGYGILIDVGGSDHYFDFDDSLKTVGARIGCGNNAIWHRPARDSEKFGYNNYGIGLDVDSGMVSEFFIYRKAER